jgi:hypothetical protein
LRVDALAAPGAPRRSLADFLTACSARRPHAIYYAR